MMGAQPILNTYSTIQICTDISLAFMVAVVVKMVVVFISMGATGISIFFLVP